MCNCISEVQERFKNYLKEQGVDVASDPELSGVVFPIKDFEMTIATSSTISWREKTTTKKGIVKEKTAKYNFIHTYCPFCGEKYKD